MTKEEIFSLAEKADLYLASDDSIIKFAKLVAEHEREACAKTAENISSYDRDEPEVSIAKTIRARGQE